MAKQKSKNTQLSLDNDAVSKKRDSKKFDYIQIQLASPETILKWSHGEVKKAETINYRTYRPEPDGLMCERIFGPSKDYECYCGKYKKYKYKGIICDRCGVEVTRRSVRRERMGHIRLAAPVAHIWYVHGVPYKLPLILDIPQKKVQSVIYYARYLVIECDHEAKEIAISELQNKLNAELDKIQEELNSEINKVEQRYKEKIDSTRQVEGIESEFEIENLMHEKEISIAQLKEEYAAKKQDLKLKYNQIQNLIESIRVGQTISEEEYAQLQDKTIPFFEVKMGAEAIQYLLKNMDLRVLRDKLLEDVKSTSPLKKAKALARLRLINSLCNNNIDPSNMILEVIPVIPPDLRPIVQISGGRFASSDLNDLYRRLINRNNRLKRLIELGAPEVILRNEKRMLQEAVDALIDNEHKIGSPVVNRRRIPLKSLSAIIRGKQGRFRQNLLGKRVDYSGRAVIVGSGRDLKINQVGVPKTMALELFKPFVIHQLIDRGIASNVRSARLMIESKDKPDEVWNILEEVVQGHPVLINRAPTLHKQSIQAFFPVLVEGDAIRIHPLITEGFNADFDGDQMAIHVPLTKEAIEEAINYMMPGSNLLKAASGEFIMAPSRDLLQGLFYLTSIRDNPNHINKPVFLSKEEAEQAYQNEQITLREPILVNMNNEFIETTVGRIVFNNHLPAGFKYFNDVVNKKTSRKIFLEIYNSYPVSEVLETLNKITELGFIVSTLSGFSLGESDLVSVPGLEEKIQKAIEENKKIDELYKLGMLTDADKTSLFKKLWTEDVVKQVEEDIKMALDQDNVLKETAESGARYSYDTINQVIGVKGPVIDANQKLVELPIKSNYMKGLDPFEYFVSAKGARKGYVDKGLRTADSGYLTRKLCEVCHDALIREEDCKTKKGIIISKAENAERMTPFRERITGRTALRDIEVDGKVIVKASEIITADAARVIEQAESVQEVYIRSPLTCKTRFGVCQRCYGIDLGTNKLVELGKAIGIIAAQSAGEPTTQLTLRTFHISGAASRTDITMGFPRIQELFEVRIPKGQAIIANLNGEVKIQAVDKHYNVVKIIHTSSDVIEYHYTPEDKLMIKPTTRQVKPGQILFIKSDGTEVTSTRRGKVVLTDQKILLEVQETEVLEYKIPRDQELLVSDGDYVEVGVPITKGNIDPRQLVETKGLYEAQKYLIHEIQKVYEQQGITVSDKHLEVIVAQMGKYVKIIDPGDSLLLSGDVRDKAIIVRLNKRLKAKGLKIVKVKPLLLGVTGAALRTESPLSAASFQEQVRVMSDAAIMGRRDYLRGLKENVIIGRLIPVGERARLNDAIEDIEIEKLIKSNA